MQVITDEKRIDEVLGRGVEEIIEKEHLTQILKTGRQIRVKFGIDPTAPDLHIGHSIPLRKLRQFQNLGHKIVLIIGDSTAMVGDPSGRSETRKMISAAEIKTNMKNYLKHAGKILDIKKTEVRYNSEWLNKNMTTILELSKAGTVQQVLHRSDFKKRIENDQDITLLEVLYPLLQGYDSVATKADLELGGTDQKFNLLMGRRVQRFYKMPEQDVLTLPLLEGIDGVKKMSKSFGNYISLDEKSNDMFGKLMSIPDNLITKYMKLCTDISLSDIEKAENNLKTQSVNPRDLKIKLASNIVAIYHGGKKAKEAEENFSKTFQKKEIPDEIEEIKGGGELGKVLVAGKVVSSMSEWHRLVDEGAIKKLSDNEEEKITDFKIEALPGVYKIGKRRFIKIT
jgi:tyrosyl-tRNA synthetase